MLRSLKFFVVLVAVAAPANAATPATMPDKPMTIEAALKAMPADAYGPAKKEWTGMQRQRFSDAFTKMMEGKQLSLQKATVSKIDDTADGIILTVTLPPMTVKPLYTEGTSIRCVLAEGQREIAIKLSIGSVCSITGNVEHPALHPLQIADAKKNRLVDLEVKLADSTVTITK